MTGHLLFQQPTHDEAKARRKSTRRIDCLLLPLASYFTTLFWHPRSLRGTRHNFGGSGGTIRWMNPMFNIVIRHHTMELFGAV